MKYRKLGKTGLNISEVSLGTWQVGGGWGGTFDQKVASRIIHEAIDQGINFIDTADVYDAGLSEEAVGNIVRKRKDEVFVATKCGRQIQPHTADGYTPKALRRFVESSLRNLKVDSIDLIQLHCPPTEVYGRPEIFGLFDDLKKEGKIKNMGVSVEKVQEAMMALDYENVMTVQIIFNMFRLKPSEEFFPYAVQKNCGIIARVPLASGLLAGKIDRNTTFHPEDHRNFNRNGEAFDKGETFSGIDLNKGIAAVEELKTLFGSRAPLAAIAIRWILMHEEVATVIPGASNPGQVRANVEAASIAPFTEREMEEVQGIYDRYFRAEIHAQW
ncbi:Predicted oxidoreductase [Cyclobacterium lianum]|uniref:Predicted oxidoreductase n=1 Tax=Cyclobacterium lianum TaxID=388280 RepID=A0A1M7NFH1_9BACT|nr:aldo/keto reductase [Cyclobacterium lianum]SHN01995.1 Predicted oxidoreductase [Cyclobacterium lianum]